MWWSWREHVTGQDVNSGLQDHLTGVHTLSLPEEDKV